MVNSRRKGHDFERWIAYNFLRSRGWTAERFEQSKGGQGNPEIVVEEPPLSEFHIEAKRYARFAVYAHLRQARKDSACSYRDPLLIIRADNEEALAILPLDRFERMAAIVRAAGKLSELLDSDLETGTLQKDPKVP